MVTMILLGLMKQFQKLRAIPNFREVCIKAVKGQFGDVLSRLEYPNLDIRTDGQRQQALNHQRMNPRVCQILENAVRILREESMPDLVDSFKGICLESCGALWVGSSGV